MEEKSGFRFDSLRHLNIREDDSLLLPIFPGGLLIGRGYGHANHISTQRVHRSLNENHIYAKCSICYSSNCAFYMVLRLESGFICNLRYDKPKSSWSEIMTDYQRFERFIENCVTEALRNDPLGFFKYAGPHIHSEDLQVRTLAWEGAETVLNAAAEDPEVHGLISEEVLRGFVKSEIDESLKLRKDNYVRNLLSKLQSTREAIAKKELVAREIANRTRHIEQRNRSIAQKARLAGAVLGVSFSLTLVVGGILLVKSLVTGQLSHDIKWAYCTSGIHYGKECAEVDPDWGFSVEDYTYSQMSLTPKGQFYASGTLFFAPGGESKIVVLKKEQIHQAQLSAEGFRFVDIPNRIVYHSFLRDSVNHKNTSELEVLHGFWKKHGATIKDFRYGTISGYPVWNFQFEGVNTENEPITINSVFIFGAREYLEIQIEIERKNYRPKVVNRYLNSIEFNPVYPGAPAQTEAIRWGGSPGEGLPRTLSEMRQKWN